MKKEKQDNTDNASIDQLKPKHIAYTQWAPYQFEIKQKKKVEFKYEK